MLRIDKKYIERNGGLLHALRKKSNRYIKALLEKENCIRSSTIHMNKLDRTIAHTHPHLDEYFADLVFRSTLPQNKLDIDFIEMAVYSLEHDAGCKAYWPNATVFGIGATASGGVSPLVLFDEHVLKGKKRDESCSQMLVNQILFPGIPLSINRILKEVNEIDALGRAHDQHIGNIIKTGHEARIPFKIEEKKADSVYDTLDAEWKKTLMDTSITSIIYCIEHGINIDTYPKQKEESIRESLNYFIEHCGHNQNHFFTETINRMKNTHFNQTVVFKKAKLPKTQSENQLLVLGRVCFALEKCWGQQIANIIMMHWWEFIYLGQLSFQKLSHQFQEFDLFDGRFTNEYGDFQRSILPLSSNTNNDVWLIWANQNPNLVKGNRAILNYINKNNEGLGIVMIEDNFKFTKTVMKAKAIDQSIWELLVDVIVSLEPDKWHVVHADNGNYAPFILNGNPSHRYIKQSEITLVQIESILKELYKQKEPF